MSETVRLPEFVDEARTMGGVAACGCGFSVRFDGDESSKEAVALWSGDVHDACHGAATDGGFHGVENGGGAA